MRCYSYAFKYACAVLSVCFQVCLCAAIRMLSSMLVCCYSYAFKDACAVLSVCLCGAIRMLEGCLCGAIRMLSSMLVRC